MPRNDCITQHRVAIYDRGGRRLRFPIPKVNVVRYRRVRDDISDAYVRLTAQQCREQAGWLGSIEPMRDEMVIFRGDERVWEGPVTLTTETSNEALTIDAKDVMYYAYKTVMRAGYSNAYPNVEFVVERAKDILFAELARKEALDPPINVLPFVVDHQTPTDAKTTAVTKPYQYRVQEHLDNLAADSGLDYTVVGRAIHLWDTHKSLGQTPVATNADFQGNIILSRYGTELATHAFVTDGQGRAGGAGGNDPYYGEVENLVTAYDEDSDEAPPTLAELVSQAQRALVGKLPVPTVVRIPDNSAINPHGILKPELLVPGVYIPLRAELMTREYTQMQKLDKVTFEETPRGETIKVVMSPAAASDEPE